MTELSIDLETRSAVDLPKANAYIYFDDPSTDVWCAAYAFDDEEPELWLPGQPVPDRVGEHIVYGRNVRAWNAAFERLAIRQVLGPRYGWPVPKLEQYRCVMTQAYAMGLPGKLEQAAPALKLDVTKDDVGKRIMLQLSKPRKPRKGEDPSGLYWWDDPEKIARLYEYCRQDVRTEQAIGKRVLALKPSELECWFMDQRMNDLGTFIDDDLCRQAQKVVAATQARLDDEMRTVTDMAVRGVSNVGELTAFLRKHGVETDSVAKDELAELLVRDDLPPAVKRALEIRQEGAKTSVAKIAKLLGCRQSDGRMRGNLQYHGASTGRWCLTGDSEVLTRAGWVPLEDFEGGDIVQWSPDRKMRFAPAVAQSFPFDGQLLRVHHDKRMDARMTFEHTMPAYDKAGRFKPTTALALRGTSDRSLPISGVLDCPPATSTLRTRILVMLQHDGYDGEYAIEWGFAKQRKSTRCQKLLASAGIRFTARFDQTYEVWRIRVRRDDAPHWLVKRDFGGWLLSEGHDPRAFIDECQHWDGGGHREYDNIEVCCAKRENAEWTVTMAHLAGVAGVVTERVKPDGRVYHYACLRARQTWSKRRTDDVVEAYQGRVYCPATMTGFFLCRTNGLIWVSGNSARGAQLQNLPRPTPGVDMDELVADLRRGDARYIDMVYGPPMTAVSDAIRGMIAAPPGRKIIAADFSQIEARVVDWLGGQEDGLEAFRLYDRKEGPDVYIVTAAGIYNVPVSSISKEDIRRQLGKVGRLSMGFEGGAMALLKMAKNYQMDISTAYDSMQQASQEESIERAQSAWKSRGAKSGVAKRSWLTAELVKIAWRKKNHHTVAMWKRCMEAAIEAVKHPGTIVTAGRLKYRKSGSWLFCQLPSKRTIAYAFPKIVQKELPWKGQGGETLYQDGLIFWGVDSFTKKWSQQDLYGGLLFQNAVQATARDIMAEGMVRAEKAGYDLILTVHDEVVAEADEDFGSLAEFTDIMTAAPEWAADLPIAADGFEANRYRK